MADRTLRVNLSIKQGYDNVAEHSMTLPADADAKKVAQVVADSLIALRSQVDAFHPQEDEPTPLESTSKV